MSNEGYQYRFRRGLDPEVGGSPKPQYRKVIENGMIIERDVEVPLRDGVSILVDVLRPEDESKAIPPLIAHSPYGKHSPAKYEYFPGCGVTSKDVSTYAIFEGPDPAYWVHQGYAVINVDTRGTWNCKGSATFFSPEEAQDFYDLVEWAGTQSWSNGKVGLTGVSYLAVSQWRVAELQPPHLAAINPWEGWTDTYREIVRHGGIPETWFWPYLQQFFNFSTTQIEDLIAETREHPLFDAFWESKSSHLDRIRVPAFIVASWTDQPMHLRGTLEGFKKISSRKKWLDVHGRMKWAYYYSPENKKRLQEFFDHFLKGIDTSVTKWPKVRLEVREKYFVGKIMGFDEWPVAATKYTKLYLNAEESKLESNPPPKETVAGYNSLSGGPERHRAKFVYTFKKRTDLIGYMKALLFMSTDESDDMDVFVGVWKIDAQGKVVYFPHYQIRNDGPVALGWIRASHREMDEASSREFQPVLAHRRELKLSPGEVVELNIEIWPSATHFERGEKLMMIVQGTDINKYPRQDLRQDFSPRYLYARHEDSVNGGKHYIYTGGNRASYLLVPTV